MKVRSLLLPAALLASCAGTSDPSPEQRFKKADRNSDSLVTREEATDLIIEDAFKMFDANGDGIVDESEYIASGGTAKEFKKHQKPGSQGISLEEAKTNPLVVKTFAVTFDEADANKSGTVSYQEYLDYIKRVDAVVR